jgi:CO/xanthine dehydrogenase Mo-binding subunit
LDVAQRDPGIQRGGDEGVPERVRGDGLGDPGAAGGLADNPPSAVPVQPPPVGGQKHGAVNTFIDGRVDGPGGPRRQRDGHDLTALAGDGQRPLQGGSGLTAALGSAVHDACRQLLRAFAELAASSPASPLYGCEVQDLTAADGCISPARASGPAPGETYTDILARHELAELSAGGASARRTDLDAEPGIFAAKFAEVEVDPDLGLVRVSRFVAAVDGGRILNPKTAASQIIGGTAGGIGMALLEQTTSDPGTGRIANATFGDYLVAVNADVRDIDVIFTGDPDPINPIGVKGIGEVAIVGVAPAIANAVFHATGQRIRSLPITAEQLL